MTKFFKWAVLWKLIKREAAVVWLLLRDPRAPFAAKLVAIAALGYLVLPFDLVTDFIPILGWIDDAVIVTLLLKLAFKLLPADLYEQLKRRAEERTGSGRTIDANTT
jgi:uncharacterized membrane protein YkvA (DUF1232 family)